MLKISEKELMLLEITNLLLEESEYHPFVFSHDTSFDNYDYLKSNQAFLDLISFLSSIGINVDAEKMFYEPIINKMLLSITTYEEGHKFWYFKVNSIDYSLFDMFNNKEEDFSFIKLFITLKNGAAINKDAICKILCRTLSSNDITQLKKVFKRKTGHVLTCNSDNSYSLRKETESEFIQ